MQVHLLPEAAAPLSSVHEHPGELVPEVYVVRAATPLPILDARHRVLDVRSTPLVCGVTRARFNHALGARPGHGVRHTRAGDRVDERRLPETCGYVRPHNAYVNNFRPFQIYKTLLSRQWVVVVWWGEEEIPKPKTKNTYKRQL